MAYVNDVVLRLSEGTVFLDWVYEATKVVAEEVSDDKV